jgi:DNA-dependent protein kinase catalytic subunit
MNKIFATDPTCENRDLRLKTFGVVPISNRLATFEWVSNTEPMKAIISKEHKRQFGGKDIHEARAQLKRMHWLQNMPENKKLNRPSPAQLHQTLLKKGEEDVVEAFEEHQDSFPRFLLRNGLENLCLTSSAFLTIKNQFIKSIAVFSIASYLIGIGDRHLENFLIDTTDGEVLGIDFGIAFGSGVHLVIPELMPFRLTMQIEGVIAPHPLEGLYQQTMVHVLNAIRRKKGLILDTCDIFVKEPLLDWVQDARQRNRTAVASGGRSGTPSSALQNQGSGMPSSVILNPDTELTELSWYPRQKIQIVREKLLGANPVKILVKELRDSVHARKDYFSEIKRAVQGPEDGCRYYHLAHSRHTKYLSAEHQVDILIELARDSNILGRTWIGWSPHV